MRQPPNLRLEQNKFLLYIILQLGLGTDGCSLWRLIGLECSRCLLPACPEPHLRWLEHPGAPRAPFYFFPMWKLQWRWRTSLQRGSESRKSSQRTCPKVKSFIKSLYMLADATLVKLNHMSKLSWCNSRLHKVEYTKIYDLWELLCHSCLVVELKNI